MHTHLAKAVALTAGYGTLALIWTVTGRGFPFGTRDPGNGASPLRDLTPETGAPLFAGVLLLAALAALIMNGRSDLPRPARTALLGYVWVVVAALLILTPDSRVLTVAGYLPILIIGAPFGYPPVDYGDIFTPTLGNQVFCIVVGLVLGRAVLRWQFRTAGACVECGRGEVPSRWAGPVAAARWGRWATWTAAAIPAAYAVVRLSWAVGIPLGISRDFLTEMQETGIGWAGAGLGAFALAGAVLTLGLVQRWGEVFPRWMIGLAGRRVPIKLATVPATVVAVFITSASVGFLTTDGFLTMFTGGLSLATAPMLLWPLWGVALAGAALAYHLRRRSLCQDCGRGGDPAEGLVRPRTADAY